MSKQVFETVFAGKNWSLKQVKLPNKPMVQLSFDMATQQFLQRQLCQKWRRAISSRSKSTMKRKCTLQEIPGWLDEA